MVTRRGSIDWLPDRWQTVLAGGTTPYAAAGPGASGAGAGALPGYRRGLLGLLPVAAAALYGTEEVHAAAGEDSEDIEGSKGAAQVAKYDHDAALVEVREEAAETKKRVRPKNTEEITAKAARSIWYGGGNGLGWGSSRPGACGRVQAAQRKMAHACTNHTCSPGARPSTRVTIP